ncbi:MAG: hypothetical protein SPG42_01405, partial [Candidatus Cryptobacteroides sp.]|nr:hypothetical protein [Candidatus Cryptobacteroides sp.]
TFESDTDGTYQSDTPGTFQTVTDGTFHSAMTGTFQSDTGGTSIPLLSHDVREKRFIAHVTMVFSTAWPGGTDMNRQ